MASLEISEDIEHEQLKWKIERIGRIAMAIILIAALFGFLGPGPFSSRTIRNNIISIDYNYFERVKSPSKFLINISPSTFDSNLVLSLNKNLLKKIKLDRIEPEPIRTVISNEKFDYVFANHSVSNTHIIMYFEFEKPGINLTEIMLNGKSNLKFSQFVYP